MDFLKKPVAVAGLFLSLSVFAGEDPQIEVEKRIKKTVVLPKKSPLPPRAYYKNELKLYPRTRIEEITEALKKIPADAITQFLNSPKVVNKEEIEQSPYVVGFPGEHIIAGVGTGVYVRSITHPKTLNYSVYHQGEAYYNPNTKELLGYEAIYVANARLQQNGDPATLMITKSAREVRIGDRLMEMSQEASVVNYFPEFPKTAITGHIINVFDGVSQIGKYNIVVIDKGKVNGIEVGHVLDIYQRGRMIIDDVNQDDDKKKVQLPDQLAGTLMIFRRFERVSYALVMKATQAIHVLDKVKTPELAQFE